MWLIIIRVVVDYAAMIRRHITGNLLQALADLNIQHPTRSTEQLGFQGTNRALRGGRCRGVEGPHCFRTHAKRLRLISCRREMAFAQYALRPEWPLDKT